MADAADLTAADLTADDLTADDLDHSPHRSPSTGRPSQSVAFAVAEG